MTPAEKSDVLFYLMYAVVAKITGKQDLSFNDLKEFDLDQLTPDAIDKCKEVIFNRYKELGGNGRVAKSSTFINEIDALLKPEEVPDPQKSVNEFALV